MGRGISENSKSGARETRAPVEGLLCLSTPGLPHTVEFHNADEVARAVKTVMPGWRFVAIQGHASPDSPCTRVRSEGDGRYSFHSFWARRPLMRTGVAGATCGVVADLSQAFLDHRPGVVGLHCGAVRIGNHLIALTGAYRAGKTTLVARFSSERGITVFCDDILPILSDGLAYGLGIQPRLRLPLPANATQEFCSFVEHSLTVSDNRYGYIDPQTLATPGTRAPLAAIIVLERQKNCVATLHSLGVAEAAGHLIRQNIADPGTADAYYDQVAEMARELLCLKLRYTDIEDATKLLLKAFGSDQIPAANVEIHPPLPTPAGDCANEPANLQVYYRRVAGVVPRTIGTDLFLWNIEDRNFYRLNPVAAAIWNLLEKPTSGLGLASTIQLAFPNHDVAEIKRDIADLLSVLTSHGLVSTEEQGE